MYSDEAFKKLEEGLRKATREAYRLAGKRMVIDEVNDFDTRQAIDAAVARPLTLAEYDKAVEKMKSMRMKRRIQLVCDTCGLDDGRITIEEAGRWWCFDCYMEAKGK